MIIVIVHHWCEPEKKEASVKRIDFNGDSMSGIPGFIRRYRMSSSEDAYMLSTVTVWKTRAAYDAWLVEKRGRPDASEPNPYSRVANQIFAVESEHDGFGASVIPMPTEARHAE